MSTLPLQERTVVVTRPRYRAGALARALADRGARVVVFPTLEVAPPPDEDALLDAAGRIEGYDWLVFTSANGVRALASRLPAGGPGSGRQSDAAPAQAGSVTADPPGPGPGASQADGEVAGHRSRIAAVGPATAEAVRDLLGRDVDLLPTATFSAEGLVEAFEGRAVDVRDRRVLFLAAEKARPVLSEGLGRLGAHVDVVTAYRSLLPGDADPEGLRAALRAGRVDLLTFTSPSTAENFLEVLGDDAVGVPAAAIGPVTADAARAMGYRVVVVADPHTLDGLVEAVTRYLAEAP